MRALHAGMDALAQLLNVVFKLKIDRDSNNLPANVEKKIAERKDLCDLYTAITNMWLSPEFQNLKAFVNHVKHTGFPERQAQDVQNGLGRATTIEQFTYNSITYGPWESSDIETMIDGFRQHALSVIDEACRAEKKFGVSPERGH